MPGSPGTTTPVVVNDPNLLKPPVVQIYEKLRDLYGNGEDDMFQMENPARLLEQGNYDFVDSDTINVQQIKPPAVMEAEFRLADDMFAISNIVGGPNGKKLADTYSEVLFELLPSHTPGMAANDDKVLTDQDKICEWLIEEVGNFDPPSDDLLSMIPADMPLAVKPPRPFQPKVSDKVKALRDTSKNSTIPRVDLYQKLLDIYEAERFRWVQFKFDARPKDFSKQSEVDAYDRLLSSYAPVIDAKLEALWTVLLVRGQYHRVRKYVGYIDIESASEILQRAKENLRASVSRSIDDTEDIYPVVLTPSNWARNLSTNFKPEDLLSSETMVREQILTAEKERASLILQKNALMAGQQDVAAAEAAVNTAQSELAQANSDLVTGYSDTAINCIQLYFDAKTKNAADRATATKNLPPSALAEVNSSLEQHSEPPLTADQFNQLKTMQAACINKQAAMQRAGEAYSRAQLAASAARASDKSTALQTIDERISSLTMDIDYYIKSLKGSENPTGAPIKKVKADGTEDTTDTPAATTGPAPPSNIELPHQDGDKASIWQEIIITYKKNAVQNSTMVVSNVAHSDWSVGLFFGSASGSSNSAASDNASKHKMENTDISIGMRVMKVGITRPWFDGGLMDKSEEYFRTSTVKISSAEPPDIKTGLINADGKVIKDANHSLMPSWTTGFVVVKDVHIIFKSDEDFTAEHVSDMQKSSQTGGGFLCFSCGKSEGSSDHRAEAQVVAQGKTLSIKIPAPQILGWISQLCQMDNCRNTYTPLNPDEIKLHPPADVKKDAVIPPAAAGGAALPPSPPPSR
ncbi:MAG: hypothetical protein Q9195_001159 [Heterodermia aff. obscurata]